MADNLATVAAGSILRTRQALNIGRKGCAKVREGRRQALALVASDLGASLAHAVPGFDLEAFKREIGHL
jgi:hypothetical protein